jgi:hypothetical protein
MGEAIEDPAHTYFEIGTVRRGRRFYAGIRMWCKDELVRQAEGPTPHRSHGEALAEAKHMAMALTQDIEVKAGAKVVRVDLDEGRKA